MTTHMPLSRCLVGLLIVFALVPSSASAGPPPATNAQTSRLAVDSLAIAAKFWTSDLPGLRVFAVDIRLIRIATGESGAIGTADRATRSVWIPTGSGSDYLARIQGCTIIVHEVGHVLGIAHSPDPRSVMGAELGSREVVYDCYRRFLPDGKMREWRANVGGAAVWLTR